MEVFKFNHESTSLDKLRNIIQVIYDEMIDESIDSEYACDIALDMTRFLSNNYSFVGTEIYEEYFKRKEDFDSLEDYINEIYNEWKWTSYLDEMTEVNQKLALDELRSLYLLKDRT